jgi:hypothetical protein
MVQAARSECGTSARQRSCHLAEDRDQTHNVEEPASDELAKDYKSYLIQNSSVWHKDSRKLAMRERMV